MTMVEALQKFLVEEIKPKLKKKDARLQDVIVWVDSYNEKTKVVRLGLALGQGTGCSPFCGCAARELAEEIEKYTMEKFPDIEKLYGVAMLPDKKIVDAWNAA